MDLLTITLPAKEARAKVAEYRRAVKQRHNDEDEAILRGYRALSQGHALVDVVDAVRRGGRLDDGHPRIAVCAADAKWCYLDHSPYGEAVAFYPNRDDDPDEPVSYRATRRIIRVGKVFENIPGTFESSTPGWRDCLRTQVPIVPPALRPAGSLRSYRILWEVEEWAHAPIPPGDPALLRHVTGTLYAVVAMWDLTELERAVLGARQ